LKVARTKAAQFQLQYDSGLNPNEAKRQARLVPTLDDFFEIYYREHSEIKNRRPLAIHANYRRYLSPTLGKLQLTCSKRAAIKEVMVALGAKGNKRPANVVQGMIRAMFNKALAWEYFTGQNPAAHIERYR
jgi:hypothetical protein